MTGEITLRGRVLPIGGLKEKSLGAHRAGLQTILIPQENKKDLEDVPESIRESLTFIPVAHLMMCCIMLWLEGDRHEG